MFITEEDYKVVIGDSALKVMSQTSQENRANAEQVGGVFIKNTMFFESFESIIVQYVGP